MIDRMKKRAWVCVMLSVWLAVGCAPKTVAPSYVSTGDTVLYALYCRDSEVIRRGDVTFDMAAEVMQSEYRVTTAEEVEFAIPFVSSVTNAPAFAVTLDGQAAAGAVWYGDRVYPTIDGFEPVGRTTKLYSPIPAAATGTLYTVTPEDTTVTVTLTFAEGKNKGVIYEETNDMQSEWENGTYRWTLYNVRPQAGYTFFVAGERSDYTFTSTGKYQAEVVTVQAYIDRQYAYLQANRAARDVPVGFFYAMANRVLQNRLTVSYADVFFETETPRLNAYRFTAATDCAIVYTVPVKLGQNGNYTPTVYTAWQRHTLGYPIRYTVELQDGTFVVESSTALQKDGTTYTAETNRDFYCAFAASPTPTCVLG